MPTERQPGVDGVSDALERVSQRSADFLMLGYRGLQEDKVLAAGSFCHVIERGDDIAIDLHRTGTGQELGFQRVV